MFGSSNMKVAAVAVATLALTQPALGFWRMECHQRTGIARIDPLVDPGTIADHGHVIHGGGNFGMSATYDDLMASDCTSCKVTQDKSAYWTPFLAFMYPNGTMQMVPQVGGMLAYYLLFGDNIQAFPKGFQMLSGDSRQRNFSGLPVPDPPKSEWSGNDVTQSSLARKAVGFNCLNYNAPAEATLYRHSMPSKEYLDAQCTDGLRLEMMFPSCWNGKDIDSKDHKSHMAFPDQVMTGNCPAGFEARVPSLLYETIWNTYAFRGIEGQFVLANGDPTGYGYHADFVNGWDVDFLQQAVNTCTNPSGRVEDCPVFTLQSDSEAGKCTFPMPEALASENCQGPRQGLPGNVQVQAGPEYASKPDPGLKSITTDIGSTTAIPTPTAVPTLSYKEGTSVVTDKYGGAVTVASAPLDAALPTETADASEKIEVTATAADKAVVTPAPSSSRASSSKTRSVSTSYLTRNGAVWEIEVEVEDVTVTTTATARVSYGRPHHNHRRGHAHRHY